MSFITEPPDMQRALQKLANVSSTEEPMELILYIYMDIFPVKKAYLFKYSPLCHVAEGIISIDSNGLDYIQTIRDDVRSIPGVYSAIVELSAIFVPKQEYLKQLGSKYIPYNDTITSLIIVPICTGNVVIGYIISFQLEDDVAFNDEMLSLYTQFGKLVSSFTNPTHKQKKEHELSNREVEVMSRVANGEILKQLVEAMGISEATIKQYIKSVIKKLGVHNRTQAVAELVRRGII
ncbi:response regulator transcription factor [Cytobacillus purgationiresistens]|uniref:DNA-binding CsgD family transcriptional regulator n=1 Tax=Cytobacillus purgationiresistens TaxID=863449 RepID=A0ABU0ABH0_9BACI|nr:LuxR C-terminal-related transcriptional regulator [Cytobacillus purgationiresistens]MDQ0268601.1 DNA-binding CsgD family transcriptional regulator [Cytobacillus purgationiresistens]